ARRKSDCSVRVATGTTAGDLCEPAAQDADIRRTPIAPHEARERVRDSRETVHARPALPGALVREVAEDARGLDDAACAGGQRDERTRAERGTVMRQAGIRNARALE